MARKRKEKNSLLLYYDYKEQFELLSDKQLRELIYSMIEYDKNNNEIELDEITRMAFVPIKRRLKEDKKNWQENCDRNQENIMKRWNKSDTSVYESIQVNTKHTDKGKGKDKDKEKDKEKGNGGYTINQPTNPTTIFDFCLTIFENRNESDLKKSCKKFYNWYEEKEWANVKDWKERLKMWINDDIEKGKIKEKEEEYVDEAGFTHKNGRRIL